MDLNNVKVKIKKTKVIGTIQATTTPLKDNANYCVVLYDQALCMSQWWLGKDLEIIY